MGTVIGLIGIYIRRRLSETTDFKQVQQDQKVLSVPLFDILKQYKKSLFSMITIGGLNGATIYTLFGYSVSYLIANTALDPQLANLSSICGLIMLMIFSPLFGAVADRTNARVVMSIGAAATAILAYFYYFYLASGAFLAVVSVQILLGIAAAAFVGPQHLFSINLFPIKERVSGISIGYAVGMAMIGGTTPSYSAYFIMKTGSLIAPGVWLLGAAVLAIVGLWIRNPLITNYINGLRAIKPTLS